MTTDNHARARAELEKAATGASFVAGTDIPRAIAAIIAAAETYHATLLAANPSELEWRCGIRCVWCGCYMVEFLDFKGHMEFIPSHDRKEIGQPELSLRAAMLACELHAAR